jgi:hypothetical protein
MSSSLRRLLGLTLLSLFLASTTSACVPEFQDLNRVDLPVRVTRNGAGAVDLDVVWVDVSAQVEGLVPGSYLRGISFVSKPGDLRDLRGTLSFFFNQVHFRPFLDRVVLVEARVYVDRTSMDISAKDFSEHYPVTTPWGYPGRAEIERMVYIAADVVQRCCTPDSQVILTGFAGNWTFYCFPPERAGERCNFRIDPATGAAIPRE